MTGQTCAAVRLNDMRQPIGAPLPHWQGARLPPGDPLNGQYCRLERLDVRRHAADLHAAYSEAPDASTWTYLFAGPFETLESYEAYLTAIVDSPDPMHHAVIDLATGRAVGTFALMRVDAANGVIEIGHVTYSPRMQRTRVSTDVMALLLRHVFEDLGYRRLEWKCDALNAPSRAAAMRYGFSFEGIFRQAIVTRGRNRDTAWYSIIDGEYPALRTAYERWLAPGNFDSSARQRQALGEFMRGHPSCGERA